MVSGCSSSAEEFDEEGCTAAAAISSDSSFKGESSSLAPSLTFFIVCQTLQLAILRLSKEGRIAFTSLKHVMLKFDALHWHYVDILYFCMSTYLLNHLVRFIMSNLISGVVSSVLFHNFSS